MNFGVIISTLQLYMSLSTGINGKSSGHRALIAACAPDRILVESDTHDPSECASRTWDMICIVAQVKKWSLENKWTEEESKEPGAIMQLARNWDVFSRKRVDCVAQVSKRSELELESDEEEW